MAALQITTGEGYSEEMWNNLRAICERVSAGRVRHSIDLEETTPDTHLSKVYECAYGIRCRVTPFQCYGLYILDFIDKSDKRLSFDAVSQISVWEIDYLEGDFRMPTQRKRTSDIYFLAPMSHYRVNRGEEVLVKIHFPHTIGFYNGTPDSTRTK